MKYDDLKPWIKIAIPIGLLLIGFVIGCFSFRDKVDHSSTIKYLEEDIARVVSDYDSIVAIYMEQDSLAAIEIVKKDSVIADIKNNVHENRKNISSALYDSLVRLNADRSRRFYPR